MATCRWIQSETESLGTPASDREQFWQFHAQYTRPSASSTKTPLWHNATNAFTAGLNHVCDLNCRYGEKNSMTCARQRLDREAKHFPVLCKKGLRAQHTVCVRACVKFWTSQHTSTLCHAGPTVSRNFQFLKGKLHHTTRHTRPNGEQRYSSIISSTSALDAVGG
jgi:hypothetical protein